MCIGIWIMLLLSVTGYVQTMDTKPTTATDCQRAMDILEAKKPEQHIPRLLAGFPRLAAELGYNADHLTDAQAEEYGFPADFLNATHYFLEAGVPFNLLNVTGRKTPREAMDEFGSNLNKTAQAVVDAIEHCSSISGTCPSHVLSRTVTPNIFRAGAELSASSKAMDYLTTLGHCYAEMYYARYGNFTHPPDSAIDELTDSQENLKTGCFAAFGRKYACRAMQLSVPLYNGPSGNRIVQICGQETLRLALDFRKTAMSALRCSEFGGFVRTYDWLNVSYHADGSAN